MAIIQFDYDSTGWDQQEQRTCHKTLMRFVRQLPETGLDYVAGDCNDAIQAMPDNPKAGHYTDTVHYIRMRQAGMLTRTRA